MPACRDRAASNAASAGCGGQPQALPGLVFKVLVNISRQLNSQGIQMSIAQDSVRDIFVGLLALKKEGLDPLKISDQAIKRGHAAGYTHINRSVSADGGGVTIELSFLPKSLSRIRLDGADWHYAPQ